MSRGVCPPAEPYTIVGTLTCAVLPLASGRLSVLSSCQYGHVFAVVVAPAQIPSRCAISVTLSRPRLAPMRRYAQLTESTVAVRMLSLAGPCSAFLSGGVGAYPGNFTTQGETPLTLSNGEYPFSNAVASVTTLNVEPGWRPEFASVR